jgi:hypothetical protein
MRTPAATCMTVLTLCLLAACGRETAPWRGRPAPDAEAEHGLLGPVQMVTERQWEVEGDDTAAAAVMARPWTWQQTRKFSPRGRTLEWTYSRPEGMQRRMVWHLNDSDQVVAMDDWLGATGKRRRMEVALLPDGQPRETQWFTDEGRLSSRVANTYDEAGRLVGRLTEDRAPGQEKPRRERKTYLYKGGSRLPSTVLTHVNDTLRATEHATDGRPDSTVSPNGDATYVDHDAQGRPVRTREYRGGHLVRSSTTTYDTQGRPTAHDEDDLRIPLKAHATTTYDPRGHVVGETSTTTTGSGPTATTSTTRSVRSLDGHGNWTLERMYHDDRLSRVTHRNILYHPR